MFYLKARSLGKIFNNQRYASFDIYKSPVHVGFVKKLKVKELLEHWELGVQRFNEQKFWEAHEEWEHQWVHLDSPTKDYMQGLIQFCAVLVHLQAERHKPALRLCRSAMTKLQQKPFPTQIPFLVKIPGEIHVLNEIFEGLSSEKFDIELWLKKANNLKAVLERLDDSTVGQ